VVLVVDFGMAAAVVQVVLELAQRYP